ncbi:hypothetical protein XNW1_3220004 [Xenorhabdus nematophila str. Websteri]|nr:hypothetical protein XNW1_3220004 [Xenorhabdus nematophila str. Websteri]
MSVVLKVNVSLSWESLNLNITTKSIFNLLIYVINYPSNIFLLNNIKNKLYRYEDFMI